MRGRCQHRSVYLQECGNGFNFPTMEIDEVYSKLKNEVEAAARLREKYG